MTRWCNKWVFWFALRNFSPIDYSSSSPEPTPSFSPVYGILMMILSSEKSLVCFSLSRYLFQLITNSRIFLCASVFSIATRLCSNSIFSSSLCCSLRKNQSVDHWFTKYTYTHEKNKSSHVIAPILIYSTSFLFVLSLCCSLRYSLATDLAIGSLFIHSRSLSWNIFFISFIQF